MPAALVVEAFLTLNASFLLSLPPAFLLWRVIV